MVECFKIRVAIQDDCLHVKDNDTIIYETKGDAIALLDPHIMDADPFLFVHNERLYLFYECKTLYKPGVIKMINTINLKTWTKPIIVLKESYHLSFPYIYEEDGVVYMIPETSVVGEVRLYKAINDDLTQFTSVATLLSHENDSRSIGIDYSDSILYKKNEKYYLFTTVNYNGENELELYVSNSLTGTYIRHISSPIIKSNKYARNAGCLIEKDGKLYRLAQDCVDRYGDSVHLLEITTLTPTEYEEHVVEENLINKDVEFYKCGGHQLNFVKFKGKTVVATDAKEYRAYKLAVYVRKILRYLHLSKY